MKKKNLIQLAVLLLLGVGVLLSMAAFDFFPFRWVEKPLEISVIIRESDSAGWASARQGMEQAAGDLGVELRFLTLSATNSTKEQRALLAREVEGGASGVVLVPADPAALASDVKEAAAHAVVVTMESDMRESGASAYISVDNVALGHALGQAALNGVPEGGLAVLLNSSPGSSGVSDRLTEAARVLREAGREVRLCSEERGKTITQALAEELQVEDPNAVLAFEPAALELAARTAQSVGKQPLIYGAGATGAIAAYLERNAITSIAAQNEFAAGYQAVEAAVHAARGETVPVAEAMEFSIIRQETIYNPDNQKLLFPVTR